MAFEDSVTSGVGDGNIRLGEKDIHIAIAELGDRYEGECDIGKFVTSSGSVG